MPKQLIEVDVPDGWEAVGFRIPKKGDFYINSITGTAIEAISKSFTGSRIIIRPAWKWPEWLKASYIAMDKDGEWFGYENKPFIEDPFNTMWSVSGDSTYLEIKLLEFTPPPCDDWTKSLRENPNWNNKHKEPIKADPNVSD